METKIQELYRPLLLFVRKRIGNQEDAEDLTQEIFYKLAKFNPRDIKNVKSWVYTIAKNTITDFYRKRKIYMEDIGNHSLGEEETEADVVQELSKCIRFYIGQLPEEYRVIMQLSELDGVPQKEIASRLNLNYVTVRSKVQRGRKKLKSIFSDCCSISQGQKGSILGFVPKSEYGDATGNCTNETESEC